jgi:GAF domain-containing protein
VSASADRPAGEFRLIEPDPAAAAELLRRRDEILTVVANAAEQLLLAPEWRDAVPEVLERLGQAAAVDRVFLFETRRDGAGHVSRMTAEWAGEGVSPSIDSPYWRAYRDDPEDVAALSQGHVVRVPTRLASGEERRVMRSEGIVTTVSVPILVAGSLWGYLGLDDCKEERPWETVETEALRAAAGILGAAVERSRSRAELDA